MKNFAAVILAAGKGTRMKSVAPKVVHEVCGVPIICQLVRQIKRSGCKRIVVVVGYRSDLVIEALKNDKVDIVFQREQLGTSHAVSMAKAKLKDFNGDLLVLPGDVFIENQKMLKSFLLFHRKKDANMSILTAHFDNPFGYGRIIRDKFEQVMAIREELDANAREKRVKEINTGIYLFDKKELFAKISKVKENKKKKEFYLTDIVEIFRNEKKNIEAYLSVDATSIIGVNDRSQLADIQAIMKSSIIRQHQLNGVTILEPASTYIEDGVKIGIDTVIYPSTYIERDTIIGEGCKIGPFCKIRQGSKILNKAQIGSFVEVVRSKVGEKTNIKHLSYIGDAVIGAGVNVGAGTITANYDGKNKNKTVISDGAFIGSNTVLIAPVNVGSGSKTGAGSVVLSKNNVKAGTTVCGIPAKKIKKQRNKTNRKEFL